MSQMQSLRILLPGTPIVVDADGERMSEGDLPVPNVYASAVRLLYHGAKPRTRLRFHSSIDAEERVDTMLERTDTEWQPYVVRYPKDAECPKSFQLCALTQLVDFLQALCVTPDLDDTLLTHSMRAEQALRDCDALNVHESYHFRPISASSSESSVTFDWPSRPATPTASGRSCSLESSVSSLDKSEPCE